MTESCKLCYEELKEKRICKTCNFSVCKLCHSKLTECSICRDKTFGEYDAQKKAEEMSEYFKKENITQGFEAAIALHNEINGIQEESDEEEENFQQDLFLATILSEEEQMQIALALSN